MGPHRGASPPLERTPGLPFKAAVTDLALPRHHRTRHPQYAGRARQLLFWREVCCSCRPPLCGGRGAHPSWGGHRSTCQPDGRVGRAGDFSLYGPSYVRGRDAPPHAGGEHQFTQCLGRLRGWCGACLQKIYECSRTCIGVLQSYVMLSSLSELTVIIVYASLSSCHCQRFVGSRFRGRRAPVASCKHVVRLQGSSSWRSRGCVCSCALRAHVG